MRETITDKYKKIRAAQMAMKKFNTTITGKEGSGKGLFPPDIRKKIGIIHAIEEFTDEKLVARIALSLCYKVFDDYFTLEDIKVMHKEYVDTIYEYINEKAKKMSASSHKANTLFRGDLDESPEIAQYHLLFDKMLECAIANNYTDVFRSMFDDDFFEDAYEGYKGEIFEESTSLYPKPIYELDFFETSPWSRSISKAIMFCIRYARGNIYKIISEVGYKRYMEDPWLNTREGEISAIVKEAIKEKDSPRHIKVFNLYLIELINNLLESGSSLYDEQLNEMSLLDEELIPSDTKKLWEEIKRIDKENSGENDEENDEESREE